MEPLEFKLPDGSSAAFKGFTLSVGLCKQLAWALAALGRPSAATKELLKALSQPPKLAFPSIISYHDEGTPSSASGRAAHNWLMASGRGSYAQASDALKVAARKRFGGYYCGEEPFIARMIEREGDKLGLPPLDASEEEWKNYAEGSSLGFQLPVAKASAPQKVVQASAADAAGIDQIIAWAKRVGQLWPAAMLEWKAAGLSGEKNPFASCARELEEGSWGHAQAPLDALGGELWVAVGTSSAGALTFISPNGSEMAELARGKTFGTQDEAVGWASRHRGVGAIKLGWSLEGFAGVEPQTAAPALVSKVLAARERATLAGAVEDEVAPSKGSKPKTRSGL